MQYLILQHPGHNRVYYKAAGPMALAELQLATHRLSSSPDSVEIVELEGMRYLSFKTEAELDESDLGIISRLSFFFALFRSEVLNGQQCLVPIAQQQYEYLDPKISSLLKYKGKTNELFTKMMLNVALLSSDFNYTDKIKMLDPVAGKGTTLFEASVYGFDAYGIELESKSVHEAAVFFKKYLETERLKHSAQKRQIHGKSKSEAVHIQEYKYARSKEEFQSEESVRTLGMVNGNSKDAFHYFKKPYFHLLVGDLPYGIAHGNTSGKRSHSPTRNPSELLAECLPQWSKVLKPGGVMVLAWNSFLVSRQRLGEVFEAHGLEVLSEPPYDAFEHMVDQSIKRDIIVARKA